MRRSTEIRSLSRSWSSWTRRTNCVTAATASASGNITSRPESIFRSHRRPLTSMPARILGPMSPAAATSCTNSPTRVLAPSPTDERQIGVTCVMHLVEHRSVGRDESDDAVLLPEREGPSFGDFDEQAVGIELADADILNEANLFSWSRTAATSRNSSELRGLIWAAARMSDSTSSRSPVMVMAAMPRPRARAARSPGLPYSATKASYWPPRSAP